MGEIEAGNVYEPYTWSESYTWVSTCRLFTFTLTEGAHLIIDVKSPGLDPEITLYEGHDELKRIAYNNDDYENRGTPNARLGRTLCCGDQEYTLRADLRNASSQDLTSKMTLQLINQFPIRHRDGAHQADHTVAYVINSDVTISGIVESAIAKWHNAVGREWPRVQFCTPEEPRDACFLRNSDREVMLIRRSTPGEYCREPMCFTSDVRGQHITLPKIHIVDPPTSGNVQYQWTSIKELHLVDNKGLCRKDLPCYYVDGALLHEIGHAVGLDDLKGPALIYDSRLMGIGWKEIEDVPQGAVDYTKQVYRHHGAVSHSEGH